MCEKNGPWPENELIACAVQGSAKAALWAETDSGGSRQSICLKRRTGLSQINSPKVYFLALQ